MDKHHNCLISYFILSQRITCWCLECAMGQTKVHCHELLFRAHSCEIDKRIVLQTASCVKSSMILLPFSNDNICTTILVCLPDLRHPLSSVWWEFTRNHNSNGRKRRILHPWSFNSSKEWCWNSYPSTISIEYLRLISLNVNATHKYAQSFYSIENRPTVYIVISMQHCSTLYPFAMSINILC